MGQNGGTQKDSQMKERSQQREVRERKMAFMRVWLEKSKSKTDVVLSFVLI